MAKEFREIRQELSGPEAAPYMGQARVLLGGMKDRMRMGGLSQLSQTKDLADGTRITVSSIFGQDKVSVSRPSGKQKAEEKEVVYGYEPYMWLGFRVNSGPKNDYGSALTSIDVNVWEDEKDDTSAILRMDDNGGTETQPLPGSTYVSVADESVYYTPNKLWMSSGILAIDPDKQEQWDVSVVWDDEDTTGVMAEIGEPTNTTHYTVAVSLVGSDCDEYGVTECAFIAIVGRGVYQTVKRGTFTIEKGTSYNFPKIPRGYYDNYQPTKSCGDTQAKDYGENPHSYNWWTDALKIDMPDRQTKSSTRVTGHATVVKDYTPKWGFGGGGLPDRASMCGTCPPEHWTIVAHGELGITAFADTAASIADFIADSCTWWPTGPPMRPIGHVVVTQYTYTTTSVYNRFISYYYTVGLGGLGITLAQFATALPRSGNGWARKNASNPYVEVPYAFDYTAAPAPIAGSEIPTTAFSVESDRAECLVYGGNWVERSSTESSAGQVVESMSEGRVYSPNTWWPAYIEDTRTFAQACDDELKIPRGVEVSVILLYNSKAGSVTDVTSGWDEAEEYAKAGAAKMRFMAFGTVYPRNW